MKPDCIIVGGGVAGYSTALELAQAGMRVHLIERGTCGQESSWAGGGILYPLLPWDYSAAVTDLTQHSISLFSAWAEELRDTTGIDPEYQRCGMLVLPPFSRDDARSWCNAHATRLELVPARRVAPTLAPDQEALWLPEVAQARNPRLLKALRKRLENLGVTFREQCEVIGWKDRSGQISAIETAHGSLSADHYIVCAGAWSRKLLGAYALKLEIEPVRGQMLLYRTPPGTLRQIILRNGMYLIPRLDGHVLAGSTLETAGFDKTTTTAARELLHAQASEILPFLADAPLVRHWAGLRPGSPDNIPTMARHPRLDNLYLNSGHFRYGVTMAPASAKIMANLILGRTQPVNTAPYRWPQSDPAA